MSKHTGRGRGSSIVRPPFDARRRRFLAGVAGAAGALALPGCGPAGSDPAESKARGGIPGAPLPNPEDCGIDHIVQVMMENRSYDHMLGWVPNSNGIQNQTFLHTDGSEVETFHLASDPSYGY